MGQKHSIAFIACTVAMLVATYSLLAQKAAKPETPMTITVTDKTTGEPVSGAEISTQGESGQQKFTTDDTGRCDISVPSTPRYMYIKVKKAGYAPVGASWQNVQSDKPLPSELAFGLEPGITIGGFIKDDKGVPVKGATVRMSGGESNGGIPGPRIDVTAKTDAEGKWTAKDQPSNWKEAHYNIDAADFFNDNVWRQTPPVAELKAKTAVITLTRAASITGKVLDPSGKPVQGASIGAGEEGWWGARHKAKTSADGTFTLKGLKPGNISFVVSSKEFAPQAVTTSAPSSDPVTVTLQPGATLKLHVVDPEKKPIAGVDITINGWKGMNVLEYKMRTDANGDATWAGAPTDEIALNFNKRGLGMIQDRKVTAGKDPVEITMKPPTKIDGTVVDATNNEPVKKFKVVQGMTWDEEQAINWMDERYGGDTAPKTASDGKFTFTIQQPYPYHAVKIIADGYLPAISRRFKNDEGQVKLEFKLEKGTNLEGVVKTADGKPVAGAKILVALPGRNLQITNGDIPEYVAREAITTETDAQGKFSVPPQTEDLIVVAINAQGFGRIESDADARKKSPAPLEVKLEPWGVIEGVGKIGSKPAAGETFIAQPTVSGPHQQNQPYVYMSSEATADEIGKFRIDRAIPGDGMVYRRFKLNEHSSTYSNGIPVTVVGGQTVKINHGGDGRPVVGHIQIPKDFNKGSWSVQHSGINTSRPQVKVNVPKDLNKAPEAEQRKVFGQWLKAKMGVSGGSFDQRSWRNFGVKVERDGKFRADDIPPGDYQLTVMLMDTPDPSRGWGPPIANVQHEFSVPEIKPGQSDEPLDLGEIPIKEIPKNNPQ